MIQIIQENTGDKLVCCTVVKSMLCKENKTVSYTDHTFTLVHLEKVT